MKLTLDWNCVIEVEEGRPQAEHVSDLINSHRKCHFAVALLAALGWQDLPLVPMPVVWGLSYFAFCFFVEDGDAFERDMNALWQVIASTIPSEPSEHLPVGMKLTDDVIQSEALSKWRNTWCDVVSAYSHVHAGRDVFVTNNTRDFQKNADKLSVLGMKHISTPAEAHAMVAEIRQA